MTVVNTTHCLLRSLENTIAAVTGVLYLSVINMPSRSQYTRQCCHQIACCLKQLTFAIFKLYPYLSQRPRTTPSTRLLESAQRSSRHTNLKYLAITLAMFRPDYDTPPGMGDAYYTFDELDAQRMQEAIALDQGAARPDRFHEFARTLTPPGAGSPMAEYMPGVGEPPSPTVMERHAEDFVFARGIPFEQEDHRFTSLADDEFMSTIPPRDINMEPTLQGMYTNGFGAQPSLLTEPVSVDPSRFGGGHEPWPEGAIDYVGQRCGRSEMEENWDRYSKIGGEHITDKYIANKTADPGWSPVGSSYWNYAPERRM